MKEIFVNLKRFDVPKELGGICPINNPKKWIEWVIDESIKYGIGKLQDIIVVYMVPEALVISAVDKLNSYPEEERKTLFIGVQGVYREDVAKGGNFGAFSTNLPAAAAYNMGCKGAMIGHSEERKDKQNIIAKFEANWQSDVQKRERLEQAVDELLNEEVISALKRDMNVLFCIGETEVQRGNGTFEEMQDNVKKVLRDQLIRGLKGVEPYLPHNNIVIGYEPIWAIGPGKTPPGEEYIAFVSSYIKQVVKEELGFDISVVYGGGLKEENAQMIAGISTIDGGLVALTKFVGDIAFEPESLKNIINKYASI